MGPTWFRRSCLRRGTSAIGPVLCSILALVGCVGSRSTPESSHREASTVAPTDPAASATSLARVRLLSQEQYLNSIKYIFGPGISVQPNFAPFHRTAGLLEVGASTAGVTFGQLGEFQLTASDLAAEVVSERNRGFLLPCTPAHVMQADHGCATQFLSTIGRLLYRRPLSPALLDQSVNEADVAAERLKNFYTGLSYALRDMLISPHFLFVIDRSEADPDHPGHLRLDAYSIASRLSLFLWDSAPDDELLQEASRGQLDSTDGRMRAVDRMLASPRVQIGVRAFFSDMLEFDDTTNLAKDPEIYPAFTGVTAEAAQEQTLRTIVNLLVTREGDYRDLFTTRDTFMSPALSPLYGVPAESARYEVPAEKGWTPYQFPADGPRAGLLTMMSFLAAHSHAGQSSPTLRGRAIRELILCEKIPDPPANVNFTALTDPDPTLRTMRQRLDLHRKNPVCAGCHRLMDPIGLGLEEFDGAGQFRSTQNGAPIDASGSVDGLQFTSAAQLGKDLHDDPALPKCLVQRLYAYAVGGVAEDDAKVMLPYLNQRFAQQGYRVPNLMRTIALSPAFVQVSNPPDDTATPPVAMKHSSLPPIGR